jgi:uncharacterized membrane protein
MRVSSQKVALLFAGWLVITDLFVWGTQLTNAWPLKVLACISISFLPGMALLRVLRINLASHIEGLLYSLGLSVLLLMVSGLAANQVLYLLGVLRPLELPGIWGALNIIVAGCIALSLFTNKQALRLRYRFLPGWSSTSWMLLSGSLCMPVLAAFGAFRLNNGGDALVAAIALCWAAGIIVYIFLFRNCLSDNILAWSVFMIGLSVLLMTSLRGWDITGHDIMREFHVFTLTNINGRWNIGAYRDPYNACLSITILPQTYVTLLHVSGLTAFKLILQILFAACPVVIYVMLRRYVSKLGALAGCILFISYPTFINDSAMLTRQGVAYLFFSLALLAAMRVSRENVPKGLFLLCGLGVVLSHYSTSYMFVAIFAVTLTCKLVIQRLRGWKMQWHGDKFTVFSPVILITLLFATLLWYGLITATSGGLITTLSSSVANIPHMLSADNKSSDTSAAILLSSHKTEADIYQSYVSHPAVSNRVVDAAQYAPEITADDMSVTVLGKELSKLGVPPTITNLLRQNFAKILQLLAAGCVLYATYLGVFYATYLFARKKPATLPLDLICLSMAGIILVAFMVVLPTLSLNYGILRTFQQALIFLLIPLMLLLVRLGRFLRPHFRTGIATVGLVTLFLLFTGLFAQALGGVDAPLTLNNHGLYYGLYYTTQADLQSYAWMKTHIPPTRDVQAASYAKALMHDPHYPFSGIGILPTQVAPGNYIYLDQAELVAQKFYVNYDGSPLIMTFPVNYYNDQANQIYSTSTTGVYH